MNKTFLIINYPVFLQLDETLHLSGNNLYLKTISAITAENHSNCHWVDTNPRTVSNVLFDLGANLEFLIESLYLESKSGILIFSFGNPESG